MKCFHPISIPNPHYEKDSITDSSIYKKIFVPCGHCPACIVSNANEWRVRLQEELSNSSSAFFFTLTYDDESLPIKDCSRITGYPVIAPCVDKRDVQLFIKRLRKKFKTSKIRYFIVSEYGPTTFRPHYHGIIFNLPYNGYDLQMLSAKVNKELRPIWNNGNILVDSVTFGRISYVTKYMLCVTDLPPYLPKPFRLMSRNPGIGSSYFNKSERMFWHRSTLSNYYPHDNLKLRLPRYYKDKIFDDAMKLEISEINKQKIYEQTCIEKGRAYDFGYDTWCDYRESAIVAFERRFNKKLKKSRKDI